MHAQCLYISSVVPLSRDHYLSSSHMLLFGCVLPFHNSSSRTRLEPSSTASTQAKGFTPPPGPAPKAMMSSVKKENADSDLYGGKLSSRLSEMC